MTTLAGLCAKILCDRDYPCHAKLLWGAAWGRFVQRCWCCWTSRWTQDFVGGSCCDLVQSMRGFGIAGRPGPRLAGIMWRCKISSSVQFGFGWVYWKHSEKQTQPHVNLAVFKIWRRRLLGRGGLSPGPIRIPQPTPPKPAFPYLRMAFSMKFMALSFQYYFHGLAFVWWVSSSLYC